MAVNVMRVLTTALIYVLAYIWMADVYGRKYRNPLIYVFSYAAVIGVATVFNFIGIPVLNAIVSTFFINLTAFCLFRVSVKKGVIYNLLYLMIVIGSDILCTYVWMMIHGETLSQILEDDLYMIIVFLTNNILLVLLWRIFWVVISRRKTFEIKIKEVLFQIFYYAFVMVVFAMFIHNVQSSGDGVFVIVMVLGFTAVDVVMVYLIYNTTRLSAAEYESTLIKKQNEIQLCHYQELLYRYDESRKAIHDMKKHFQVLDALESNDGVHAKSYGEALLDRLGEFQVGFACSNSILGVIMGQKMNEAESKGITVRTNVGDLLFDYMEDIDITAIFSNLWDNAIEACGVGNPEDKVIEIVITGAHGFDIIRFKNTYDGNVKKSDGGFLTTKSGHQGLGLMIIKDTVAKYDGTVNISCDSKLFEIVIMIQKQS